MTAQTPSAAAPPDPPRSPAALAYHPNPHRRGGPTGRGHRAPRTGAGRRDDPVVIDLVIRARNGDLPAWDALIERYAPLIWSICRRHRLDAADAADAGQNVWLALVGHLDQIRDPAALPGWLATVTRRECLRVLGAARRSPATGYPPDAGTIPDEQARTAEQDLLAAERHATLREAFQDLPPAARHLILLLVEDPPVPYAEISARLGIPVGSIGPTRRRWLDKLRRHPAIAPSSTPTPPPPVRDTARRWRRHADQQTARAPRYPPPTGRPG